MFNYSNRTYFFNKAYTCLQNTLAEQSWIIEGSDNRGPTVLQSA